MLQIAGEASQGAAHLEKRKAAALHLLSACPGQEKAEKPKGGRLDAEGKLRLSNSEAREMTSETPQAARHTQNCGAMYGQGSIISSDSEVTKNGQIKSIVRTGNHPKF